MATVVTFNGVNYSIPAVNEEDWQSLSNYLIALASGTQTTNGQRVAVRVSTNATTTVATTDCILLINVAGAATVNLPAGVEKQIFYIADLSGAAATNNIIINRNGANTILGGTSYTMNLNGQIIGLVFTGGNWYRFAESFPSTLVGPVSSVDNGVALFNGTTGRVIKDLGVGSINQVLTTNGTTPAFSLIVNNNIDASAAIAYSKLALSNSIVNADISASAAIAYSKLNIANSIVNADISASAAIAYSKLNLSGSIVNADIAGSAAIAYSKLALSNSIVNADISGSAAIAYSKLALINSIVNADISGSAAIAYSKLNLTNSIVNADISALAAIVRSKLAQGTPGHVIINDGSGNMSSTATLPVVQGGTGLSALGSALQVLRVNVTATALEYATVTGLGDVSGPASSVTNGVVLFASTTGKAIKDLGVGSIGQVLTTNGTTPAFSLIVDGNIDGAAAISYSKLALSNSIVNADISGSAAIAYSKLALSNSIVNADISASAAIAYSKLNLSLSIVNADISTSAAIALNKLATLTASRALVTDGSGTISAASVTATELGYLVGVTSAIQTQIDSKAGTGTANTFTLAQTISAASNQLVLSSGVNQLTLNSSTSAAARTYSFPDVGTTGTVAMLEGSQTFTGLKTFSNGLAISGGSAANNTIWFASNVLNIRGGTSGTDIYNTSGNVIFDITDGGVMTWGPSASDAITHVSRGSINMGGTAIPSFSSSTFRYFGSTINALYMGNSTGALGVRAWAGAYFDGTSSWRTQSGFAAARAFVNTDSTATNNAFAISTDNSTGHSVPSAASFTNVLTTDFNGLTTVGPSSSTNQNLVVNGTVRFEQGDTDSDILILRGTSSASACRIRIGGSDNAHAMSIDGFGNLADASRYLAIQDTNSTVALFYGDGKVQFPTISTTASSANAFIDSGNNNNLLRSTSSKKYKQDIRYSVNSSILYDLLPCVYKSKADADDKTKDYLGFIAEDIDTVEPKLVHYSNGTPDGVQYERITVLLVNEIKLLKAKLDSLSI